MSEHEIQKAGIDMLNSMPRVRAYRNNTGAIKKGSRFIAYGLRSFHGETGGADVVILADGVPCACECKRPGEKPTKVQLEWAERWRAAGGLYWRAETVEQMVGPVREILARRAAMRRGADDDRHVAEVNLGEAIGEPVGEPVGGPVEEPKPKARVVKLDPMLALYGKKRAA